MGERGEIGSGSVVEQLESGNRSIGGGGESGGESVGGIRQYIVIG